ncbi:MAG: Exodeoxyribonuclease [candidate division WS2 bacterium ADurb.Bin280]|uniref:Exodeoxyribonuclease n=1 Tax=candidate division WS2 bacterium ADurb.Bin280 TaxID=1852829 RepID=A0A1V5SEY4_9BACT|nr:MAG: Exodeoxyribonuclease [candidate division WS2 bacterium ADurb.Bin280]
MHRESVKIVTWNINGLRSGWDELVDFLNAEDPDIVCLQEIKIDKDRLADHHRSIRSYSSVWLHAQKSGYSGVAVYYKKRPEKIKYGIGIEKFDREGRVLTVDFGNFVLVNAYFPHSGRDLARIDFKMEFNDAIEDYLNGLTKNKIVFCGDFNVAHKEIDIARPKDNKKNAGFTQEERDWFDNFLQNGWTDVYRSLNPEKQEFSWWSNFYNARQRNIGWRIDYFATRGFEKRQMKNCEIKTKVMGSDHAPVIMEIVTDE